MDANMKVRIVRDCLTTAKADLPDYMSQLWVREMPVLEFHGTMAAESTENVARKSRRAHWLTLKGKLPTTIKINVTN